MAESSAVNINTDTGIQIENNKRVRWSDFPVAGNGKRFIAAVMDGVFYYIGSMVIGLGYKAIGLHNPIIFLAIVLMFYVCYWWAPLYMSGQTVGKKIMGLKVVTKDYRSRLNFIQIVLRELIGKTIGSLVFLMGYIWIFMNPEHRGWHDFIGSTRVLDVSGK
jgi:uncharacterized RDD family membrane protein YckC